MWREATMRALGGLLLAPLVLLVLAASSPASEKAASIVIDANSGAILHASNAEEPRFPASLTKMMTLYLVFEALERKQATLDTRITFSERASEAPPSKIGLDEGETITVRDAILALIVKSANDVAVAVAEHFAGSERAFARAMTAKARALGLRDTTFQNASGLPSSAQVTTARDMVSLGLRLQEDFPRYYPLFATRKFAYRGKLYRNHNGLLHRFGGTEGIKTGYIRASGFNVVTSYRRGRKHLIGAVFGARSAGARDGAMRALLSKALLRASTVRSRRAGPKLIARPRLADRPKVAATPRPAERSPGAERPDTAPGRITMVSVRSVPVDPPPAPRPAARPALRGGLPPAAPTAAMPAESSPVPRHSAGLGRRPSTLQQQAMALAGNGGNRMAVGAAPRQADGGYEIQIGAFRSLGEARNAIAAARARAPQSLAGYGERTLEVRTAKGTTLYRSRFAGFDAGAATTTCLELRRRSVDCFVARP
ncbi:MAG: hypothetical protein RLZ98_133 [Pseudomonadota bacterium]|jgi:D-alanyl-D-alanine carboxypeptidase